MNENLLIDLTIFIWLGISQVYVSFAITVKVGIMKVFGIEENLKVFMVFKSEKYFSEQQLVNKF